MNEAGVPPNHAPFYEQLVHLNHDPFYLEQLGLTIRRTQTNHDGSVTLALAWDDPPQRRNLQSLADEELGRAVRTLARQLHYLTP